MLLNQEKQEQFIKKKTRLGRRRTSAVGRVPTDYNYLNFAIMLQIKAVINRVELSNVDGVVNIKIFTNAMFDGFKRNVDTTTGAITFEKAKVNFIKFYLEAVRSFCE